MRYPLLLKPVLKDYLWGGRRLTGEFGFSSSLPRVAEAWLLSCHPQGESTVKNGPLAGKTLTEALESMGIDRRGADFPLLIKLIDAKERLSLQVHPDDAYAQSRGLPQGKTEMWVVLDCAPGAELIFGLRQSLSDAELKAAVFEERLEPLCRHVAVRPGDVFFIPAGTVHAIGAGILIAEIQQNSDVTYRVSDYGRLGADGQPRPLHREQALAVIHPAPTPLSPVPPMVQGRQKLTQTPFFSVERVALAENRPIPLPADKEFLSVVCLSGEGELRWDEGCEAFHKGDSLYIPAGLATSLHGTADLLFSRP